MPAASLFHKRLPPAGKFSVRPPNLWTTPTERAGRLRWPDADRLERNPDVWSVENGAITATSTTERRVDPRIVWAGGEPADFELTRSELEETSTAESPISLPTRAGWPPGRCLTKWRRRPCRAVPSDPKWTRTDLD